MGHAGFLSSTVIAWLGGLGSYGRSHGPYVVAFCAVGWPCLQALCLFSLPVGLTLTRFQAAKTVAVADEIVNDCPCCRDLKNELPI